jgi:hypothetical protein
VEASHSHDAADVHEVVYTSAPKLLNGGANLGIVAATGAFSSEVDRFLRPLRAYSTPEELASKLGGKAGEKFSLLPASSGESSLTTFTRASFSSVAHLGRTTPMVQHLAVHLSSLDAAGLSVADFIGWVAGLSIYEPPFGFLTNWQGDPEQLEPRRLSRVSVPLSPAKILRSLPLADAVHERLLGAVCEIVDVLLHASTPERKVFLVIPFDWQPYVPVIFAAVVSVLPSGVQKTLTAVSQAWEMSDVKLGPRLVITHPGSPLIATMSRPAYASKAAVIDLTREATPPGSHSDPGGRIVAADLVDWSREGSPSLPDLFDELDDPLGKQMVSVLALKRRLNHWLDSLAPSGLAETQAAAMTCDLARGADGNVSVSAAAPLMRAIDVGCQHLVAGNRWGDLLLLLDARGLSPEASRVIETHIFHNFDRISELAAESVARMSMASPGMERMLDRSGKSEHFLAQWLAAMDTYTTGVPDRIGEAASRFSRLLGAPLLRAAWQRLKAVGLVPHAAATFTTAVLDVLVERVGRASQPRDEARPLPSPSVPRSENENVVSAQVKS